MEVYLNVIEMGNGVYGAEAASQYYFRMHAKDLTPYQAASIASIIPDPLKWKPYNMGSRPSQILQQMANLGGVLNYDQKEAPQAVKYRK